MVRTIQGLIFHQYEIHDSAGTLITGDLNGDGSLDVLDLALSSALRKGEILNLKWSDVDLDRDKTQLKQPRLLC